MGAAGVAGALFCDRNQRIAAAGSANMAEPGLTSGCRVLKRDRVRQAAAPFMESRLLRRVILEVNKPTLVWVDQLTTSSSASVPSLLLDRFSVRTCSSVESLQELLDKLDPAAVFFDFDYPDRRRLAGFSRVKEQNASTPVVMVTLQHSESLAVWTYRHGALDYLVKPVNPAELGNCVDRILEISKLRLSQQGRTANPFKPNIPSDIPNTARTRKDKLSPAIYFVQQNFSQRIYSDAMARLCGMSASHFSRAFKQHYRVTFQEFLLRYRVRRACQKLQARIVNIADVAYAVGFSDPSYFTRVFKRFVGLSPSEYSTSAGTLDDAMLENIEDKMTSSSQIVRQLSGSFQS